MKNSQTNPVTQEQSDLQELTPGFIDPESVVRGWDIQEGEKIADLGCGGGYFTIPMAHMVKEQGKVFAVDIMEGPVEAVRSKAYLEKLENVEALRANLEKKNSLSKFIKAGECQHVILANILYASQKKKAIIQEAKRILATKGKLIIIDWVKDVPAAFRNFGPPMELRITEKEVKDMVKKDGFAIIESFNAGQFHFGVVFKKK